MEPEDLKQVGTCLCCGVPVYYSESEPTDENSNVGDYDFVCYGCEFMMAEQGTWKEFVQENLHKEI